MRDIIVGPSHVVRLEHLFKSNIINDNLQDAVFIGRGGAPTWSLQLFKWFEVSRKHDDAIHLIIGDFRFGNSIVEDELDINESKVNHINVTGRLINEENDLLMVTHFTRGLLKWKNIGADVNFIPWTLIMRRADNITKGSHVDEGGNYNHPQLDEVEMLNEFCDLKYIKCLDIPVETVRQFYIDGDLHPSTLGYMFILDMIKKHDPYSSISSCIAKLSFVLNQFLKKLKITKTVLITGDSIAISTLSKVIPFNKHGFEKFRACSYTDFTSSFRNLKNDVVIVDLLSLESTIKYCVNENDGLTKKFPWDYLGFTTISKRHMDLHRLNPNKILLEGINEASVKDSFFDIGERLTPTIKGVLFIISLASDLDIKSKNEFIEDTLFDIFRSESKKDKRKIHLIGLLNKILATICIAKR